MRRATTREGGTWVRGADGEGCTTKMEVCTRGSGATISRKALV